MCALRAQVIWRNVSSFFLSEDCSTWARNIAATNVSIYAAAGATLINSVTLRLDGNKTVSLPVVNASTFAQGASPCLCNWVGARAAGCACRYLTSPTALEGPALLPSSGTQAQERISYPGVTVHLLVSWYVVEGQRFPSGSAL